jgi:aminoglycoside phosphotransferase (APT) family kinase protein
VTTPRASEALDAVAVDTWLRSQVPFIAELQKGAPAVKQFTGGASNWTYQLDYPGHALVLRRPPAGRKAKSAHDMGREYRVQSALAPHFPRVPEMVAHCADPAVLGAEFYVMRRVDGLIPRKEMPMPCPPPLARRLCEQLGDCLVELHGVDLEAAGLAGLGRGAGYARRQIEGWSERYVQARTWNVPDMAYVRSWLAERIPEDAGASLVHGDFRFDNVVLAADAPEKIVGVLDWELATVGCPLMDLGNSLAYWVEADDDPVGRWLRRQPTHLPGMLSRADFVSRYFDRRGWPVRDFSFYEVYGMFRLAVIAQQIYQRWHLKQSKNPAFRHLWVVSHYLAWRCRRRIAAAPR